MPDTRNRRFHFLPRIMQDGTPLAASLASIGSAGVSACTGGVCTVAAQAGAGFSGALAGTGSSLTGILSVAGSSSSGVPLWLTQTTAPSPTLPWWLQVLILLLIGSTLLTVYSLAGKPKLALLAGTAGILCVAADLGWIPGGQTGMDAALGLGVPLLVLSSWLPRLHLPWRLRAWAGRLLLGGVLLASLSTLYLQFGLGWHPCLDCWMERAALWSFTILGFFWLYPALKRGAPLPPARSVTLFLLALFGYLVSFVQELEITHAQAAASLVAACGATGPSCAKAGSQLLLGHPIAVESLVLFGILMPALLLLQASPYSRAGN